MIKKTFYNLSDEKRGRVEKAVLNEFANPETEKVSINRIIKEANISRGSFYQYFDDKIDLVEVLFRCLADALFDETEAGLRETNGDVFAVYEGLLDYAVGKGNIEANKVMIKNIINNLRAGSTLFNEYICTRYVGVGEIRDLTPLYSSEKLGYDDEDRKYSLQCVLNTSLLRALFRHFVREEKVKIVKSDYLFELDIIKRGAAHA